MAGTTKSGSRNVLYIVIGVIVVAALVGWAIAMFRGGGSGTSTAGNYPVALEGAVVVAGKKAPNTVDVYEDLLCPICGRFESSYGGDLTKAINDGKIQVRYHPVAILNRLTTPPGYSQRAANAVVCSAEAGVFSAYHEKLYAEQPKERSAGYTDQQLIEMAQQVKAPASFAQCVTSSKHLRAVQVETQRAGGDASLRAPGRDSFGTPTIMVNGKRADLGDDNWLKNITK
ncbi:DsbA family protein [Pseudonocardia acaciae]|uniref:DsbA family protein n=1 Tax=Pseudonocardia acaciae TaxID=551276 RepID=UPI000A06925F|nr:thioredoxin domain-containing protein [Pseudonocardia acaciae]